MSIFRASCALTGIALASFSFGQVSFTGLGFLPSGTSTNAYGVSSDGQTVVGYGVAGGQTKAFYWRSATGLVAIPQMFPGFTTRASGVSADGSTIVGLASDSSSFLHGFRWTASGFTDLGTLPGTGAYATAISSDGVTTIGGAPGSQNHAFRHTLGGGMVELSSLGFGAEAGAVTGDGSVIVGWVSDGANPYAVKWQNGIRTTLGLGNADGVSAGGAVIVGQSNFLATYWTAPGNGQSLGDFAGGNDNSNALGISSDGSVIAGWGVDSVGRLAAFWRGSTMYSLQDYLAQNGAPVGGWRLVNAFAVSADGSTIVGSGTNPNGQTEAFVARIAPVPEPTTCVALLTGCILAFRRRRR